ncbi:MAG: hypothetical protein OXC02_08895 [Rhodobacteraceae bacterium]|nr:hypothetical protein [Paracoccaceae bacterium]
MSEDSLQDFRDGSDRFNDLIFRVSVRHCFMQNKNGYEIEELVKSKREQHSKMRFDSP